MASAPITFTEAMGGAFTARVPIGAPCPPQLFDGMPLRDEVVKVGAGASAFWVDRYESSVHSTVTAAQLGRANASGGVDAPDVASSGLTRSGQRPLGAAPAIALSHVGRPTVTQARDATLSDPCVSASGAHDMVGSVWEWTDEWFASVGQVTSPPATLGSSVAGIRVNNRITPWSSEYGGDATSNITSTVYNEAEGTMGVPAAALRGGYWADGTRSGVFALDLSFGLRPWIGHSASAVSSPADPMGTSIILRDRCARTSRRPLLVLILLGAGCTPFPATPRPVDAATLQDSSNNPPDQPVLVDVSSDASVDSGSVTPVDAPQDAVVDTGMTAPVDATDDVPVDAGVLPVDVPLDTPVDRPDVVDAPVDVPLPEARLLVGTFASSGTSTGLLTGGFTWHGGSSGGLLQGWLR